MNVVKLVVVTLMQHVLIHQEVLVVHVIRDIQEMELIAQVFPFCFSSRQ